MEENLKLYNELRQVPKEAQKDFDNGSFKGTDINAMWRIKKLTEMFGVCGIGWYIEIKNRWNDIVDDQIIVNVEIELFIKQDGEWSKPILGIGGNQTKKTFKSGKINVTDEAYKMALTDAIGVACKHLGMGADIYWQTDKSKYTTNEVDYNAKLKEFCKEYGINIVNIAKEYKLNANTSNDRFKEVYEQESNDYFNAQSQLGKNQ